VILGLGIDLVEVARMEQAIARGERLVNRLFTPGEVEYCRKHKVPAVHFAARFAAKEAGMKAIGTGWSNGVGWRDFEVRLDPRGRPMLVVTGKAAEIAQAMGVTHSLVSLAHDAGVATAVVVLEGEAMPAAEAWLSGRSALTLPEPKSAVSELIERTPGVTEMPKPGAPEKAPQNEGASDEGPNGDGGEDGR
jgi:holo-[acyl-carrier protein] synthase